MKEAQMKLLNIVTAAALAAIAIVSFAQSTGSSVTPSDTPSVTPSQTPSVTPSQTPSVTPSQTPSVTPSQTPSVGGLSKCENLLGTDRDKCLQEERGGTGSTSGRAAGAGGSHAPGSTGTGAGTMGPQNTAPAGTVR
jgi:hypothetical protein